MHKTSGLISLVLLGSLAAGCGDDDDPGDGGVFDAPIFDGMSRLPSTRAVADISAVLASSYGYQ